MEESTVNQKAALYAALAAAQGAFLPIEKNRTVQIQTRNGGSYAFRYADLEEILSKTRPALAANGLALVQCVDTIQSGLLLRCELLHAAGGSLHSETPIARPVEDPKAFGASISYIRRYLITAMLGVAADDDLDEDGQDLTERGQQSNGHPAGQKPAVAQPQRRQEPQPQPQPAQQQEAGGNQTATVGEIAYVKKKIEAAGLTIAQAREQAGIAAGDTLDGITKADFAALKGVR